MIKRALLTLGFAVVLSFGAAAWWVHREYQALDRALGVRDVPLRIVIEPGMTLSQVSRALAARGVLENPHGIVWYARWQGVAQLIKAGEYALTPGMTPRRMLQMFLDGAVVLWPLTIIEGWSFEQLRAAVRADERLVHTLDGLDPVEVMERLGHEGVHPEGWFYPDTYHFPRGTTDVDFLKRALRTMRKRLAEEWSNRAPNLPYLQPYDALILASIVEKETGKSSERGRIAGVFVRRLRKGMRLEADPTVIYGLGPEFDGNITRKHLRQETPYNTYVRRGLPPTPIAMPGGASLHAALHPLPGQDLFFVATGDGGHHFSPTYEEHAKAVRAFQLQGANRDSGTAP